MPITSIFRDKEYLHRLFVLALPLILQQLITYSVNLLDTMMIGSFGDISLAAVNLVNQFYLLFSIMIFGTVSGGSVLNAQYWGKRDADHIHRVMGIQFLFGFSVGLFFLIFSQAFPHRILSFYSKDEEIIRAGTTYLRFISAAFILFPAGQFYSGAMRCTGNTRIPMYVSFVTLGCNVTLNYLLIFGKLGLPMLGLTGAAIATVTARAVEAFLYILITYARHLPTAAPLKKMMSFDRALVGLVIRKGLPVIGNEFFWALGSNVYTAIYASISTVSIAAYSAVSPIDYIAQSLFFGVGDACAVMIGNLLGADEFEKAKRYARHTLILSACTAFLIGIIMFGARFRILGLYNLSAEAAALASRLIIAVAFTLWLRCTNYTLVIGILRPGGQAFYCFTRETLIIWCGGIPLAWMLANYFHLPVYWVYFGNVYEEAVKMLFFLHMYRSGKWITDLVG